jgi:DegV family protein with EDD domain
VIALVTDSTAYFTKAEAEAMGIKIVPMSYTVANQLFVESYGDHNGDFEALIARFPTKCKTSQASISEFMSTFEELIRQNYEVICPVISSRLSGTYSCASLAAKAVNPDKIIVVDSHTTAGGLSLFMKKAVEFVRSGYPLKEVADKLEAIRDNIGIAFSVTNMDALRRSGRLTLVRQSVSTILNLRPILLCEDGALIAHGTARGKRELIQELTNRIPKNATKIVLQALDDHAVIGPLTAEIRRSLPNAELKISTVGPVICINIGLGAIGVSWICEE